MRSYAAVSLIAAMLSLSGCGVVSSTKPLFDQGSAHRLHSGLWASLDKSCAVPADAHTAMWAECAKPFLFDGNTLSGLDPKDGQATVVLSDTDPVILQMPLTGDATAQSKPSDPAYLYAVVNFGTARPATEMTIGALTCPDKPMPGLRLIKRWRTAAHASKIQRGDFDCVATTPAAVLAVARMPLTEAPSRMVWIADAVAK